MIRVLWVTKGLGPGGAERLLVSAARVHDRASFELEAAYVLSWKDALAGELRAEGVGVHCLGVRDARDPRWISRLRRLVVAGHYDVVHAHLPLTAAVTRLVVHTLPRHTRPRIVTTEHNAWSTYAMPTRLLNAMTAGLDDAAIAVSDGARDSVWWPALRRRTEMIIQGVAVDEIRSQLARRDEARVELGVGDGDLVVATVANFRPQKAYPDLLKAARLVVDRGVPAQFFAIGQGPMEVSIRDLHADLRLGQRFRFLGMRDDAPFVLAGADLFVLASLYEGLPVALMEALALGLPIVATAVGGVTQVVQSGVEGLLVPPSRPGLLAEAIIELASDRVRLHTMAAAAMHRATTLDRAVAVRRIEEIYRSVARPRPGGPVGTTS